MKISTNQRGSSHVMIFLVLGLIVIVGLVAFRVNSAEAPTVATTLPSRSTDAPKDIKSTADLRKAESALDETQIDGTVNPNKLDEDLNAL